MDPQRHRGTCYQASNWERVGQTRGRKAQGDQPAKSPKDVYLYPLRENWQQVLCDGPAAGSRPSPAPSRQARPQPQEDERFTALWQEILEAVVQLAHEHDALWMRRRRVLNTLLVVLFVFRLVFAPNRQGYGLTLRGLWAQCRAMDIPLPQPEPVSPSAMHTARSKVRDELFLQIHRAILRHAPRDDPRTLWRGHRAFAVDGSQLTLPRPLLEDGYRLPHAGSHYPQGLLSCLFRLRSRRCRRLRPRLLLLPHYVRDFTYDEDRCRVWVRDLPRNLACLTNAAISIIRCQSGFRWVPEANRHYAARPQEALGPAAGPAPALVQAARPPAGRARLASRSSTAVSALATQPVDDARTLCPGPSW